MASTLITAYLGQGLAAARPAAPAIAAGSIGWYYATDTGAVSYYAGAAWHAVSATDPSIAPNLAVPANPGWDPNMMGTTVVLTSSNRIATPASGTPYNYMYGAPGRYTGKLYFEYVPGSTSFCNLGFCGAAGHVMDNGAGSPGNFGLRVPGQFGMDSTGAIKWVGAVIASPATLATVATWAAGNTVAFALDLDAGLWWTRVGAGSWNNGIGAANPATGVAGFTLYPAWAGSPSRIIWPGMNASNTTANSLLTKTADFAQAVPAGFSSWSGL